MEMSGLDNIKFDYFAILVQFILVTGFVAGTFILSHAVGPKRKGEQKLQSFECGLEPIGSARLPFSVKYFLAAILFVLFDIEIIFFYPWAVNFRELGYGGLLKMIIFITPFMLGYYYVIKKGALKWG